MAEESYEMKNSITGISIADLIAAPLKGAADAQLDLAKDGEKNEMSIQAPLLAVVPVPNLAIEEVNVEFQMEVTSTTKEQTSSSKEENRKSEGQGVTVCGKVSSQASGTRETNQSAKYQIQVKARKQETPEGLSRILDVMAQTIQGKEN